MAAGIVAGLLTASGGAGTAAAADASHQAGPRWTAAAAHRFWTDRRMAAAKPLPEDRPSARTGTRAPVTNPAGSLARRAGTGPGSSHFGGLPMIGRMYVQRGSGSYFCTASVINSRHHDVVLTAGHCLDSRAGSGSLAFVPQWTAATPRPHGIFPVATDLRGRSQVWIDQRYYDRGHTKGAPWDVAFARLGARSDGKQAQDVVGGNTLVTGRGYAFPRIRLVGYPNTDRQPLTCTNSTTRFTPTDGAPGSYLKIACNDYRSGTSGSPFLANFDARTGRGDVVGSIGGWKTGGPTADVSYSPNFGSDVQRLYDAAVAGAPPARPGTPTR
ncbi:trypsin-like serine peptidase [Streptomyces collinus]|uniref:trypsin-like serine peptidase n=1 Tax=Streptomyces collinus TaxID=42684 RepID=UPI0036C78C7F